MARRLNILGISALVVVMLGGATQQQIDRFKLGNERLMANDAVGALSIFKGLCAEGLPQACQVVPRIEAVMQKSQLQASAVQKFQSHDILGARRDFKKLCDAGEPTACENVTNIDINVGKGKYVRDKLGAGDIDGAVSELRQFCNEGSAPACEAIPRIARELQLIEEQRAWINEQRSSGEGPSNAPATDARATAKVQPAVMIKASLGTGCITAELVNVMANHDPNASGSFSGQWRLTNKCGKDQIVAVESAGQDGYRSDYMPAGLANIGAWRDYEYLRKLPSLPFAPVPRYEDGSSFLISAGQYWFADDNNIKPQSYSVWLASCDAYSAQGIKQAIYRSKPSLSDLPQIACAPGH